MVSRGSLRLRLIGALVCLIAPFSIMQSTHVHAQGACVPGAADNVVVTCSGGDIIDQNFPDGFGGNFDNVTVNVLDDANIIGTADGIFLDNNIVIDNAGSIIGSNLSGIDVLTLTSLTNSGSIEGVNNGVLAGLIQNLESSGRISALGNAVEATVIANMSNSGDINSEFANGVAAFLISGLTNSGSISGDGNGVTAFVIESLNNSGTITSRFANGVVADTILSLNNSGLITGPDEGVEAFFIQDLVNSGTIESPFSDGIDVDGELVRFVNYGIVTGGTEGVDIGFGTIINKGLIIADKPIEVDREVQGNAFVANSGSILSTAGPGGTAIDFQFFGNDTLKLSPGSIIVGGINLGAGSDKLIVENGLSIANTFDSPPEVIDTNGAPFAVNGNQVAVVDPTLEGLQDEILADLTNGIFGGITARLDGLPGGSVVGITQPPGAFSGAMRLGPKASHKGEYVAPRGDRQAWAHAFGAAREQDAERPTVAAEHRLGGLMSGLDGQVTSRIRAGFYLGGTWGKADTDFRSQSEEIDTFFGGVYARHDIGQTALDVAVTVGHSSHERERQVANNTVATGLQEAQSAFDGIFTAAELGLSREVMLGRRTIKPGVQIRYAGHYLDGFTETGAAGNLTVADRDVHLLQGRAQVALPFVTPVSDGGILRSEARIGIEGRTSLGDDSFSAVLLGQQIAFAPGGTDEVISLYGGASFSYTTPDERAQFYASLDGGLEDDGSAYVTGRLGAKIRF